MRRLAYRQMHHPPCTAHLRQPAKPVPAFGNRLIENVPGSCAFLGKGKGPEGNRKGDKQSPESGKGWGDPKNGDGNGEGWLLLSPHKVYWLIDDLVYYMIEAGYNGVNSIAEKLGKKKPIARWVSATGAFALGNFLEVATTPNPNGSYEWGITPGKLAPYLGITLLFALMAKTIELYKGEEAEGGENVLSGVDLMLKWVRFPAVILTGTYVVGALFSENALTGLREAFGWAGVGTFFYLLSNENGTGKKVKAALGKAKEEFHAGLAERRLNHREERARR